MTEFLKKLPQTIRGLVFMSAGITLLLHTLGILQKGINYLIIIASLYLIISGFIQINGHKYIISLFFKKSNS